ncbi:MAG: zinc ribbon domain-containing protein [Pseudomonadales bacterium]|jgi:hypothetical protein|nr:zinc ribbon domain-containing protein [Pseudomonadales bacterium]
MSSEKKTKKKFCTSCGAEIRSGEFCSECGNKSGEKSDHPPQKWYKETWGIVLSLIFCFPVGLVLMWLYTKWDKKVKIAITAVFLIITGWSYVSNNIINYEQREIEKQEREENRLQREEARRQQQKERQQVEQESASEAVVETDTTTNEYRLFVASTMLDMGRQLELLSEQSLLAGANPSLLFNDEWRTSTVLHIVSLQMLARNILDFDVDNVPQGYESSYEYFNTLANLLLDSMDYYMHGVDNLDATALVRASELQVLIGDYAIHTTEAMP